MVTDLEIRKNVRRLMAVFSTSKAEDEVVEAWKWVLASDVEPMELAMAVSDYAKSGARYFPTPGQLREAAMAHRTSQPAEAGASKDWNQLQEGPCPVCGAVLQLATDPLASRQVYDSRVGKWRARTRDDPPPTKRYTVVHDLAEHARRDAPVVGQVDTRRAAG